MISRVFDFVKGSKTMQGNGKIMLHLPMQETKSKNVYDVFINHRGTDTKRNIASLLYDDLKGRNLKPFLDNKNMKPGDKLFDHIDRAVLTSKLAVTVFSPNYCNSYFCLHELALMMESRKKIIPLFCDIKPSQLDVMIDESRCTEGEIRRFRQALQEAKHIVGLTFDSYKGNLSEIVTNASDTVVERLKQLEAEEENL
ncbi:PREDICTED: toll/interleukin-1 receptor-like protein [Tarenaya hassleriana]|uniref:toll/interleukin-1 receptor-like protein n=1 Tax=Tarenaya hassleriana TaxID=28532 RepID=UPI00053C106D|nr:PREDICTED: toll/interleukin-1 receptor-like protein [Tarenaya hassleriana]